MSETKKKMGCIQYSPVTFSSQNVILQRFNVTQCGAFVSWNKYWTFIGNCGFASTNYKWILHFIRSLTLCTRWTHGTCLTSANLVCHETGGPNTFYGDIIKVWSCLKRDSMIVNTFYLHRSCRMWTIWWPISSWIFNKLLTKCTNIYAGLVEKGGFICLVWSFQLT